MMPSGCKVLHDLSSNIVSDETNTIDDRAVIEELHYTEVSQALCLPRGMHIVHAFFGTCLMMKLF